MINTIRIFTIVILSICQLALNAQSFEGHLTMKMEVIDVPAEMESMKAMFESTIQIYIKNEQSRSEMTNALTGNMVVISDGKKNEVTMLMDMMGEKTAVVYGMEEYKAQKEQGTNDIQTKKTGITKVIAGHTCEKVLATIKTADGSAEMEVWCAKDIQNVNAEMADYPGMPLEYTIIAEGIKMHFITTEITEKKVDENLFTIPAGYTKKTSKEFEQGFGGKH